MAIDEEVQKLEAEKYNQIMDEVSCWNGLENELLKLLILFQKCYATTLKDGTQVLSRDYVLEKVSRLMNKQPIILDPNSARLYGALRISEFLEGLKNNK